MLSYLFSYAASRVAGDAVEGVARRAMWGALAAVMLLASFVLGLMIAFWTFEPIYGAVPTAAVIAGGCAVIALLAIVAPAFGDWRKRRAEKRATAAAVQHPISTVANVVKEETEAAADYFGAVQVVASAFMFGLGAARQMRGR